MSALPCPVPDPFAEAEQAYATISKFLHAEEARQVKHSELERQLEAMGRELMPQLLQAHLDLCQSGEAREKQEYERKNASHYADHRGPDTVAPAAFSSQTNRRSTIKIVKKPGE